MTPENAAMMLAIATASPAGDVPVTPRPGDADALRRPSPAGSTAPADDDWETDFLVDGVTPENVRAWVKAEPALRDKVIELYVVMTAHEVAESEVTAGGEIDAALAHGRRVARRRLAAVGL